MSISRTLSRTALISVFALLSLNAMTVASVNTTAPDSISVIQATLPDSVSLSGKVVYVDFFASWCAPCQRSFPWMRELYKKYHTQGLEIIAIDVDKDHSAALQFLKENPVAFPILFDSTGNLAKQFKLKAMPMSFVYGRDGKLFSRNQGFRPEDADSVSQTILQLLNKGK